MNSMNGGGWNLEPRTMLAVVAMGFGFLFLFSLVAHVWIGALIAIVVMALVIRSWVKQKPRP